MFSMFGKKIKIAFIKFGGMANGGTEKYLQTIAAHLPKNRFKVDFYYCDAAPYIGSDFKHIDTDQSRVNYCTSHGVNLIKFDVGSKDVTKSTHDWVDTNFWDVFDEDNYDVIQTGRSGHPEYPFHMINKTPIVDSIHLAGMAERKKNVAKTVLVCEEQKDKWIAAGGDPSRALVIPVPVEVPHPPKKPYIDYREWFGWEDKFVFGMHQRADDGIFSMVPLNAYQKISNENTAFFMLGGSHLYKQYSMNWGLERVRFIDPSSDLHVIHSFLNTLDVYAHGRSDGEQCSSAIIEGLSHSLPVISHTAPSLGQVEQIGDAGAVEKDAIEYSKVMKRLMTDTKYYDECSKNAEKRYKTIYNMDSIIQRFIELYEDIVNE